MAKKIKVSGYESFIAQMQKKELTDVIPSVSDYHRLKEELGILPQSLVAVSQVQLLENSNEEYSNGWDGIRALLSVLWRKFMGDKFKSQELAHFVFSLLLQGIESGWKAVTEAIRKKMGDKAVYDIATTVDSINVIVSDGNIKELIDSIKKAKEELSTSHDEKSNFWAKILRGLSVALKFLSRIKLS